MKRIGACLVLIAILTASSFLAACQSSQQAAPPSESPAAPGAAESGAPPSYYESLPSVISEPTESAMTTAAAATPDASELPVLPDAPFTFEETEYADDVISIKYPRIIDYPDASAQLALNRLIADSALRELPLIRDDDTLGEYELYYTVTRNSPEVLSIIFDGYANYKQAAHPYQFFYSVTIDVRQQKVVTLPQLVSITPEFLALLPDGALRSAGIELTVDYVSAVRDSLRDYDTEFMLQELGDADTFGHSTSSYLTEDSLGISVSVPHVMGDHVEVLFKFDALDGYKTDDPFWEVIEK